MVVKKSNLEDIIINAVTVIFVSVFAIFTIYPIFYCLINALSEGKEALIGGIYFLPKGFTLKNFEFVFSAKNLFNSLLMTVLRTSIGTFLAIICTSMAGYALAQKNLIGKKFYMIVGLITLYFPVNVVYSYLLYAQIGLLDNFSVYILPNLFQFYYMILFISFVKELPNGLIESARIDGSSEFTVLFKIIMPISKPIIATLALFIGVWHWNDWFSPAFFITDESLMTMPAVLMRTMSLTQAQQELQKVMSVSSQANVVTPESIRYAMLIVAVTPITLVYPFIQKYFVKGMMIGSVKE
ncbi:MAG: carbohydrate ABC transporter permease [Lachnospirales bacterium]